MKRSSRSSLGGAKAEPFRATEDRAATGRTGTAVGRDAQLVALAVALGSAKTRGSGYAEFHQRLVDAGLGHSYEAAHARLAVACMSATVARQKLLADGKLAAACPAASQAAADKSYVDTVLKLCDGLEKTVKSYRRSDNIRKKRIWQIWSRSS